MRPVLPLWAVLACATVLTTGEDSRDNGIQFAEYLSGINFSHYFVSNAVVDSYNILGSTTDEKTDVESSIRETLDLLRQGDKEIILKEEYKDNVLILGNTGAGKSTFTLWITGDEDELFAVRVSPGRYVIRDKHGRISNSTITSQTVFPELFIENITNIGYYDFPGFSDTRSSSYDIATSYFIKKVLAYSESAKLVFVVSYPSVSQGVDRQDFMKLAKHSTELVKNITKFANSICMVVTKVPNIYEETDNGSVLVDDNDIIEGIVEFLKEVKGDLETKLQQENIPDRDKIYYEKALKFVEVLLIQDKGRYSKIGLFRMAIRAGPLSKIPALQKERVQIKEYIDNKLIFTETGDDDFDHTISDKSKNEINDVADAIFDNILENIEKMANEITTYYKTLIQNIKEKIMSFKIDETNDIDYKFQEIKSLTTELNYGLTRILQLAEDIKKIKTPEELSVELNKTVNHLNISYNNNVVDNILSQGKYITFLQNASGKKLNTNPLAWSSPFQSVTTVIAESNNAIQYSVNKLIKQINEMIEFSIKGSVQQIKTYFLQKEVRIYDIQSLEKSFNRTCEELTRIQNMTNSSNPNLYLQQIRNIQDIDIKFSKYVSSSIIRNTANFVFLRKEIDNTIKYLHDSQIWYRFLSHLYDHLSIYEIQKDTTTCNALSNEINQVDEDKVVSESNLKHFLSKCYDDNNNLELDINNMKLDKNKINSLKQVFSVTLKTSSTDKCEPNGKLVVKGLFVKLSDVVTKACVGPMNTIEIFALYKVFIDSNLNRTAKNIDVSIIAPIWEIIGEQQILLEGLPGESPKIEKAKNATAIATKGNDGKPGLAGGVGGNILGIANEMINGRSLKIFLTGGRGGRGQIGGDGSKGSDGASPKLLTERIGGWLWSDDAKDISSDWTKDNYVVVQTPSENIGVRNANYRSYYYVYGTNCSNGGNGGDGGHGGNGGNPGIAIVIPLSQKPEIKVINNTGNYGVDGKGGTGGEPGVSGGHITVEQLYTIGGLRWLCTQSVVSNSSLPNCQNGKVGDENNMNGMEPSENAAFLQPSLVVNDYKVFIREKVNSIMREEMLRGFLDQLDNNTGIQDLYDLKGFYIELIDIERQFYALHNRIEFLPFYQSLLVRINKYSETNINKNDLQNEQVLMFLQVACMSKISSISNNLENYFVVDTKKYFKLVAKHIEQYKSTFKEVKIDTYAEQYHSAIVTEITKANDVIEKNILPEIDNIYDDIDSEIKNVIQDILKEISDAEKEKDELYKLKDKMSKRLAAKSLLGLLKFSSQFLMFAGPGGAIAAGVIGKGTDIAGEMILDGFEKPVVNSAKKSTTQILNYYKKEQQNMKNNLIFAKDKISQNISTENSVNLYKLLDIVTPLQKLLERIDIDEKDYVDEKLRTQKELDKYLVDLKESLSPKVIKNFRKRRNTEDTIEVTTDENSTHTPLYTENPGMRNVTDENPTTEGSESRNGTGENPTKDDKTKSTIKWGEIVKNSMTVASSGYDYYKDLKKNDGLMSAVVDAIDKVRGVIKQLKDYEQLMYNVMIPMRKNFEERLKTNQSNKTHAELDVSKWRIQNTIKDFQVNVEYMVQTSDPIIKLKLLGSVEKLQSGMQAMISIYDRIQDYYDKAKLAKYIADLNSNAAIDNDEFKTYVNKLELVTKTNLVLQEFDKAAFTFKQYMFPFAGLYLDRFELLPDLKSDNISDLVFKALTQIDFLRDELTKEATVIKERTRPYRIYPDISFEINKKEEAPFYVWKHETHKNQITDLLKGDKITIKADITEGLNRNAVKFREIGLHFLLKNKTLQTSLDEYLSQFLIEITHLGDSHYKCDDMYVIIPHSAISMEHSVNLDNSTHHYTYLDKIATQVGNNPPMCSPYATWELHLKSKNSNDKDLDTLKKFVGEPMDLALEGWGQYLELNVDVCDHKLMKYYQIDNTVI